MMVKVLNYQGDGASRTQNATAPVWEQTSSGIHQVRLQTFRADKMKVKHAQQDGCVLHVSNVFNGFIQNHQFKG